MFEIFYRVNDPVLKYKMGFIPEDKINEVRDRVNIVSVISQYVHLKKAGVNYKAPCPFHVEKTPSFVVSESKRIYHCFGCGKGGNVFTFLMERAGLSFPEAVQKLANDVGIILPKFNKDENQKQKKEKKELFYKINKTALIFFKEQLKKNERALNFLLKRGLVAKTISQFHLGYAPAEWNALGNALKRQGISEKNLIELGLMVRKTSSETVYDHFRDRIMFPLFDLNQRVLGFGGRRINEEALPKYLNSIESPIYYKGRELYGLFQAVRDPMQRISKSGVLIVEGYFDCLLLVQAGFTNGVATMGTALTSRHIDLLRRFTDQFYLLFDGDEAGGEATERTFSLFIEAGIWPKVVEFPFEEDPDDFIRRETKEALTERIKKARPIIDVVLNRMIAKMGDDSSLSKAKVIENMVPHLKMIPEGIEREEVIKKISDRLQVDEKWILKPISLPSKHVKQAKQEGKEIWKGKEERSEGGVWKDQMRFENASVEVELIEFFVLFPQWIERWKDQKVLDLFMDLEVKMVGLEMINQYQQMHKIDFPALLERIDSENLKQKLVGGVLKKESQNLSESEWKRVFDDCVKRIQRNHLERIEKQLLRDIKACEKEPHQEEEKVKLLAQYQNIVKQKQQYH